MKAQSVCVVRNAMQFSHHHQLAMSLPLRSKSLGHWPVCSYTLYWVARRFLTFLLFVGVTGFFCGRGGLR